MAKKPFNNRNYSWKKTINYRRKPSLYKIGKGEQGVLICEPFKSEILPYWRFQTPELALKSAKKIYSLFLAYLRADEFVGADMARKYLQMGFTRSRRYVNYKGGRKYKPDGSLYERNTGDPRKAQSANIFFSYWKKAEKNKLYLNMKTAWKKRLG